MTESALVAASVLGFTLGIGGMIYAKTARYIWVAKESAKILGEDVEKYKRLPSRAVMMWKFWIWDIDKFLKEEPAERRS